MVTEPISFTGNLSLPDVLDIHRVHSRIVLRRSIWWLMTVVSGIIAAVIIFAGLRSRFVPVSFLVLAVCAYFPFGGMLVDHWLVRRRYRRNRDKFLENTASFTNESISLVNAKSEIRVAWDLLGSVVTTPRGLLFLFPPHAIWFWLPRRLFEGNAHRESILALAAEHRVSIREMT